MRDWNGGEHPPPSSRRLRPPGVLRLRPSAAVSGTVRGARPGGSGRVGQAPPTPQEARARTRSRTAGPACGQCSAGAGRGQWPHPNPTARLHQGPPTCPQKGTASNQSPGPARHPLAASAVKTLPTSQATFPRPGGPPGSPAPVLTFAAQISRSPESSGGARTGIPGHTVLPPLGKGRAGWGEPADAGTPVALVRAPLARSQTFVKEDAGDPERGEEQREVLAAVHSAVGEERHKGAGLGPPSLTARGCLDPCPAPSHRASLGSVDALELRRAGGKRRRHVEGPARRDHLQREVGWGRRCCRSQIWHPDSRPRLQSGRASFLFPAPHPARHDSPLKARPRGPPAPALRACPVSTTLSGEGRVPAWGSERPCPAQ